MNLEEFVKEERWKLRKYFMEQWYEYLKKEIEK